METQHRFGAAASVPVLANSLLFRTSDLEEARDHVSRVFCSHRLRVVGERGQIDAEMYFRQIRGIGVGRILYGASVVIEPGQLNNFALVQMPISGAEVVEHGGETVNSTPDVASVLSPTLPLRMRHGADTEKLVVKIDRDALERHCRQHVGGELRKPVEFRPEMSLITPRSLSWMRLMSWLCNEVGQERSGENTILDSPLFSAQIEQMVITTLLLSQPHNYSERLENDRPSIAPHFVRKVEQLINDNAHEPLTIGYLAEHAGVSTRSLFAGFRKYRNMTPMFYLKEVRLHRVREALLQASPDSTTVTNVAMRWGFSHLGNFASDYKRAFDESPSTTLGR